MENLKLTGQELYILQLALANFEKEISIQEFKPNSLFTKDFFNSHIKTLNIKIEILQEKIDLVSNN
jgi:hypothetical protein